jgi:hypothetical protein
MDKKKIIKTVITAVVIALPLGLVAVGSYYGYKKYRKEKEKKDAINKE